MWKATLLFVFHRFCLILVAVFAIQKSNFFSQGFAVPKIKSTSQVLEIALSKINQFPEYRALEESHISFRSPMLWLSKTLEKMFRLSAKGFFFILSNLFFWLFLRELFALTTRMIPLETAEKTLSIAVLWPSSMVLNLGSSLSLSCFLAMYSIRNSLDSRWLSAGCAAALLALTDPFGIGLVFLLLAIFWAFERHLPAKKVARQAGFFLLPLIILGFVQWQSFVRFGHSLGSSGFLNAYFYTLNRGSLVWAFQETYLGQTLAAFFVTLGSVSAMASHTTWVHRTIPIFCGLSMLLLSPYGSIAHRSLLAAPAFEGVATLTARPLNRILNAGLTWFGAYTIYQLFTH